MQPMTPHRLAGCLDANRALGVIGSCADRLAIGRGLGVIALVVSLQLLGSGCARLRHESTPEFTPISDEVVGALRAGGARAAARLVGHYVGEIPLLFHYHRLLHGR